MKPSLIALAILGCLGGLVYWLPASLVVGAVATSDVLPEKTTLGRVSGRIWEGEMTNTQVNGQTIDTVQWSWRPAGVRRAELAWQVNATASGARANAEISWRPNRVSVRDLGVTIPAPLIAEEWVPWPLLMEGTIVGRIERLRYSPAANQVDAVGVVRWDDAASGYPQPAQLGWLQADITTDPGGKALQVGLESDQRFLNLDGGATVEVTGDYSMALKVSPGPSAEPRLINALRLLGLNPANDQPLNLRSTGVLAPGGLGFPTID